MSPELLKNERLSLWLVSLMLLAPVIGRGQEAADESAAVADTSASVSAADTTEAVADTSAQFNDAGPPTDLPKAPPLPSGIERDSLGVLKLVLESNDPDIQARIDSLNQRLQIIGVQERLTKAEQEGRSIASTGRAPQEWVVSARIELLEDRERVTAARLTTTRDLLSEEIEDIDRDIAFEREMEIASLEEFVDEHAGAPAVVDAKFILAQLYYERSQQEFTRASAKWTIELRRSLIGLVPQRPPLPVADYSSSTRLYHEIIRDGRNQALLPYTYYALGFEYTRQYKEEWLVKVNSSFGREKKAFQAVADSIRGLAESYYKALLIEFPHDTVNAPDALLSLAAIYVERSTPAARDTAIALCKALISSRSGAWYSPRYQNAMKLLIDIHYYVALSGTQTRGVAARRAALNDALVYAVWLAKEVDLFEEHTRGYPANEAGRLVREQGRTSAVDFITQILTIPKVPGYHDPIPPVNAALRLVQVSGKSAFGAGLLREIGERQLKTYDQTEDEKVLREGLTAYDSLLAFYPTFEDGPKISKVLINNSFHLAETPEAQSDAYYTQLLRFYNRFNKDGAWARTADVSGRELTAADDSSAKYLERSSKYFYISSKNRGDTEGLHRGLDLMREFFTRYPEREAAYELNWSLAGELQELGDVESAYEEYIRISSRQYKQDDHREDAAINAISLAQGFLKKEAESAGTEGGAQESGEGGEEQPPEGTD